MSRVEQFLLGSGHNRASIHVGLVNNMPDAAMRATELQFARLLKEAAGALDVRLRLFSMRSIPRGEQTRSRMAWAKAWSRSAMMSSLCSMPTEMRIVSEVMPALRCSASGNWRWVVEAG